MSGGLKISKACFKAQVGIITKILHWPMWTNLLISLVNVFMPTVNVLGPEGCVMIKTEELAFPACTTLKYLSH